MRDHWIFVQNVLEITKSIFIYLFFLLFYFIGRFCNKNFCYENKMFVLLRCVSTCTYWIRNGLQSWKSTYKTNWFCFYTEVFCQRQSKTILYIMQRKEGHQGKKKLIIPKVKVMAMYWTYIMFCMCWDWEINLHFEINLCAKNDHFVFVGYYIIGSTF